MKFLLISNHRSGTKILRSAINTIGGVNCINEALRSVDDTYGKIHNIFKSEAQHGIIGIDVKYSHIDQGVLKYLADYPEVKTLQLIRRDMLETVLWRQKNLVGKLEGGFGPPLILKDETYEAIISNVIADLTWLEENIRLWHKRADLTVFYEDDLTNNENALEFYNPDTRKKVCTFFGKQDQRLIIAPNSGHRKNVRPKTEDIVSNYDDLLSELELHNINRFYNGDRSGCVS